MPFNMITIFSVNEVNAPGIICFHCLLQLSCNSAMILFLTVTTNGCLYFALHHMTCSIYISILNTESYHLNTFQVRILLGVKGKELLQCSWLLYIN